MKNIAVITGSRAEYGLLRCLIGKIESEEKFQLRLLVTGSHTSDQHGKTVNEIIADGFQIHFRLNLDLSGDTAESIGVTTGFIVDRFARYFTKHRPDLLVVLGDRYEAFACCVAALFHRIPIAHIHGGELTEGAIDDPLRHSITKMASLHFVAHEVYRTRVIQLGENPEHVFTVGGLGVEAIKYCKLENKQSLFKFLGIHQKQKMFLINFHPETNCHLSPKEQIVSLLDALESFKNTTFVFSMPNADAGGRAVASSISSFVEQHQGNAVMKPSLGQKNFLSCLKYAETVIGNSSSGLLEAPSFGIPTINIGKRQKGRLKAESVIDCDYSVSDIKSKIEICQSKEFKKLAKKAKNPYDNGVPSELIVDQLRYINFDELSNSEFFDQ